MTRRTLAADVLVAGLLVGTTHCRTAPEKSTKITPSTQRDTQSTPLVSAAPPGGWGSSREATAHPQAG